jgi:single-strand DNA-binding protein
MPAKSVNKVILVGNLGRDPEVKYTASGVPVAKFSVSPRRTTFRLDP